MARGLINICRVMFHDGQQSVSYLSGQVSGARAQTLLSLFSYNKSQYSISNS